MIKDIIDSTPKSFTAVHFYMDTAGEVFADFRRLSDEEKDEAHIVYACEDILTEKDLAEATYRIAKDSGDRKRCIDLYESAAAALKTGLHGQTVLVTGQNADDTNAYLEYLASARGGSVYRFSDISAIKDQYRVSEESGAGAKDFSPDSPVRLQEDGRNIWNCLQWLSRMPDGTPEHDVYMHIMTACYMALNSETVRAFRKRLPKVMPEDLVLHRLHTAGDNLVKVVCVICTMMDYINGKVCCIADADDYLTGYDGFPLCSPIDRIADDYSALGGQIVLGMDQTFIADSSESMCLKWVEQVSGGLQVSLVDMPRIRRLLLTVDDAMEHDREALLLDTETITKELLPESNK